MALFWSSGRSELTTVFGRTPPRPLRGVHERAGDQGFSSYDLRQIEA